MAEEKDYETRKNEEAEYTVKNQEFYTNDLRIYGHYDYPPVPADK